jgi:hypothetical protein
MPHGVERPATQSLVRLEEAGLIAPDGATLPAFCVRCGAACTGAPDVRVYRGFPAGTWWLYLLKLGARRVVIRLFGKRAMVGAFVCDQHTRSMRMQRLGGLVAMLSTPLVLFGFGAALGKESSGTALLIAAGVFFIGYFYRALGKMLLSPTSIERDGLATFALPSKEFASAMNGRAH